MRQCESRGGFRSLAEDNGQAGALTCGAGTMGLVCLGRLFQPLICCRVTKDSRMRPGNSHLDGAWGRSPTCRSTKSETPCRARGFDQEVCPTLLPKVRLPRMFYARCAHEPIRFMGRICWCASQQYFCQFNLMLQALPRLEGWPAPTYRYGCLSSRGGSL